MSWAEKEERIKGRNWVEMTKLEADGRRIPEYLSVVCMTYLLAGCLAWCWSKSQWFWEENLKMREAIWPVCWLFRQFVYCVHHIAVRNSLSWGPRRINLLLNKSILKGLITAALHCSCTASPMTWHMKRTCKDGKVSSQESHPITLHGYI